MAKAVSLTLSSNKERSDDHVQKDWDLTNSNYRLTMMIITIVIIMYPRTVPFFQKVEKVINSYKDLYMQMHPPPAKINMKNMKNMK